MRQRSARFPAWIVTVPRRQLRWLILPWQVIGPPPVGLPPWKERFAVVTVPPMLCFNVVECSVQTSCQPSQSRILEDAHSPKHWSEKRRRGCLISRRFRQIGQIDQLSTTAISGKFIRYLLDFPSIVGVSGRK